MRAGWNLFPSRVPVEGDYICFEIKSGKVFFRSPTKKEGIRILSEEGEDFGEYTRLLSRETTKAEFQAIAGILADFFRLNLERVPKRGHYRYRFTKPRSKQEVEYVPARPSST